MWHWLAIVGLGVAGLAAQAPLPPPPAGIDPAPLTHLMAAHGRPDGTIDYAAWRSRPGDLAALDGFIAAHEPEASAAAEGREAVAGWINLHNALAIRDILRHPQWQSVRQDRGFFTEARHTLRGTPVSLEMLAEHGVVPRLGWRARAVLLLPARGGPPAPPRAVGVESFTQEIEAAWRDWLAMHRAFGWSEQMLRLPQPLFWHRQEWEAEGGWREALAPLAPQSARPLLARRDIRVEYLPFDWTLNDPSIPPGAYGGWRLLLDRLGW